MKKQTPIAFDELESALEWSSSDELLENQAFIERSTGKVYFQSRSGEFEVEQPEDLDDGTLFIAMPNKKELDLGRSLVFEFVEFEAPGIAEKVHLVFRKKGAYRNFKYILEDAGLLAKWYAFEEAATKTALLRWADENGFLVSDADKT